MAEIEIRVELCPGANNQNWLDVCCAHDITDQIKAIDGVRYVGPNIGPSGWRSVEVAPGYDARKIADEIRWLSL